LECVEKIINEKMSETTKRTQLAIDECKDWILRELEIHSMNLSNVTGIRYIVDKKWEFVIFDYLMIAFLMLGR